ncbi:acyl transferase/acyl hydrolase/lysophospholipase, partial [Flagelloscypha sp. PMI_526]
MTNAFSKPGIAGARILIIEGEQSWDNGILSAFPILEEMMQRAGYSRISESKLVDQENASKALPCECFDYIIGSGEGGWLALMLGRLGMSVSQAQKAYITIRHKVSNASQDQRAATLEECLMDMVETMTISSNQDEKLQASTNRSACDTAVLAMTSAHLAAPTVFRTYSVRKNATQNCSIWSAIRACTADPKVFPPAQIGGQNYISASVADNSNPIDVALEEVKMLWPDMKLGAVVSIGSGHRGPISAESPDFTEHLAKDPGQSWQRTVRAGNLPYYRFNVDQGLQWLSSSKANYINTIFAHSSSYLQNPDIDEKLDELVSLLSAQESQIPQFESPEGSSTSNLGLKVISSPLTSTISRGPRMRIHHSVSTTPPVRTYMNELYKAGHGLPLWDPQPLFKCKPVEIGDVGLITEDGGFEILFNATVPAEQQKYRLPPNFIPLDINNADIQICTEVTSAPYIVCGDIKLHAQGFPGGADDRNSGEFELTFDAMRGAVLVLSDPPVRLSVRP